MTDSQNWWNSPERQAHIQEKKLDVETAAQELKKAFQDIVTTDEIETPMSDLCNNLFELYWGVNTNIAADQEIVTDTEDMLEHLFYINFYRHFFDSFDKTIEELIAMTGVREE